jgi:hypothetical protein
MRIARVLPTAAELATNAIVAGTFITQITAGANVVTCAEICAELAAEAWEKAHDAIPGVTIDSDITDAAALILADQGAALRHANIEALYATDARIEKAIGALSTLRHTMPGSLLLADANEEIDDIEDNLDAAIAKLKRATLVLGIEIDRVENAASRRRNAGLN